MAEKTGQSSVSVVGDEATLEVALGDGKSKVEMPLQVPSTIRKLKAVVEPTNEVGEPSRGTTQGPFGIRKLKFRPYHCGQEELWGRQTGLLTPLSFSRRSAGTVNLIQRLERSAVLEAHKGCVNTVAFNPSGDLLLSGSDDREIIMWDWRQKTQVLKYASGHDNNVFQARVMPHSDDRTVVTAAADGQVRVGLVREDGAVETKRLAKHKGRAHKIAIEPGSGRTFYSCGEDAVVRRFDLRERTSSVLFKCREEAESRVVRLNCIFINPRRPEYFALGGDDEYARVYDIRRLNNDFSNPARPVDKFAPRHLVGNQDGNIHITAVSYSQQEELLVSYNDELIYLFDRSQGWGTSWSSASKKPRVEDDQASASLSEPQVYEGHRNNKTVKGVSFFGPNTEYVVSGSDCGHLFIWKKYGGELVGLHQADSRVVNCLEPHPMETVLATSGIEEDIKIWTPTKHKPQPLPYKAKTVMARNKRERDRRNEQGRSREFAVAPEIILHLFRMQRAQAQYHNDDVSDGFDEDEDSSGRDAPDGCPVS
eukprot:TRINITY_DN20231_c0_g1_i1.p1 TRINITY_DN20231_c0_g1~~TRINITY_DN20231_c0_g1_i1.p1  ORF type:complete len:558 (+),score=89.12 TRINITY_DN20231_c0_g1_i1:65-1675(+)